MGLSDIAKGALLLIGSGIIAERFGAGAGLAGLGGGIREIAAAPMGGLGTGLREFSGGLGALASVFSDIGKGIGDIFANIPRGPWSGIPFSPIITPPNRIPLPVTPTPTPPIYVSSGNAGNSSNIQMNSALPYNPLNPTKGLGRIYQVNGGVFGFRKAPSLSFKSRREARTYLKAYGVSDAMDGTSV